MFKVSFKETPKNPYKLVTKLGNETTVLLRGTVDLPAFWKYIPEEICEWIAHQTHIEGYEDISKNQLIIYSRGIAKCHPEDKYNTVLGERMAESRAKYFIYKFFYNLCYRLEDYYQELLFGKGNSVVNETMHGIVGDFIKYEKLCDRERHHQVELLRGEKHE